LQGIPELLMSGHEREYLTWFRRREARDPLAVDTDVLDEDIKAYSGPGGLRSLCNVYRESLKSGDQNRELAKTKLKMPVLAVGGEEFIGEEVERQARNVAENVSALACFSI
jgi:hypothetical protein